MADELVRRSYSRRDKDAYESESDGELETEDGTVVEFEENPGILRPRRTSRAD